MQFRPILAYIKLILLIISSIAQMLINRNILSFFYLNVKVGFDGYIYKHFTSYQI